MIELSVRTTGQDQLIDVTDKIAYCVRSQDLDAGCVHLFVPHTTAAITINENADPDVVDDFLKGMDEIVPALGYKHAEGNSPAHIKSSLIGVSLQVRFDNRSLLLGTWQGIYFCEFDGPRQRKLWVTVSV